MVESEMTTLYVVFETDLTPYEGGDTFLAVFDTDEKAKAFVTKLDKQYGSEYTAYGYEIVQLNQPKYYKDV